MSTKAKMTELALNTSEVISADNKGEDVTPSSTLEVPSQEVTDVPDESTKDHVPEDHAEDSLSEDLSSEDTTTSKDLEDDERASLPEPRGFETLELQSP